MKNHIKVNGKLLQTNKKWSHLKLKQKEFIYNCFKEEYKSFINTNSRLPKKNEKPMILNRVYEKIEEKEIWIPFIEVEKFFRSKYNKLNKLMPV